ncbi:MAG: TolB family protein, partial [Bryobacteraceae bacterium]
LLLGGSVSDDGTILFSAVKASSALYMVSAGANEIKPVEVQGLDQSAEFRWPEFVAGSQDFLFNYGVPSAESAIYLATLRDGTAVDPVLLMRNDTAASFTPAGGGRVVFVRDDNLYAQKLNRTARKLEGAPELIERGVASSPAYSQAQFSVSRTGALAWRPGRAALSQVNILDRNGTVVGTAGPPATIQTLRPSPDETRLLIAFDNAAWLLEPNHSGQLRLEQGSLNTLWFPDGSKFLSVVSSPKGLRLVERPVTGTGQTREMAIPRGLVRTQDISADGKTLLFNHGVYDTGLFSAHLDGTNEEPRSLIQTGETIVNSTFSPDGRWILYQVNAQDGGIYVQPFPGPGLRRQIASSGGYPVWRKDGREIVYLDGYQGQTYLWSVPVSSAGGELRFSAPTRLFPVRLPATMFGDLNFLAVSRDGSRFYIPQAVEQPATGEIQVRTGGIR